MVFTDTIDLADVKQMALTDNLFNGIMGYKTSGGMKGRIERGIEELIRANGGSALFTVDPSINLKNVIGDVTNKNHKQEMVAVRHAIIYAMAKYYGFEVNVIKCGTHAKAPKYLQIEGITMKSIGKMCQELENETKIQDLTANIIENETKHQELAARVDINETQIQDLAAHVIDNETKHQELAARVDKVEQRVIALENKFQTSYWSMFMFMFMFMFMLIVLYYVFRGVDGEMLTLPYTTQTVSEQFQLTM